MHLEYHNYCIPFDSLSAKELYRILKLRSEIFIVEQECPYQDLDDKDYDALHMTLYTDDELIAYARILPVGVSYAEATSIGRVVVKKKYRGLGLGKMLMNLAISRCIDLDPRSPIQISAQSYLEKFYQELGFSNTGKYYLEDGLPHQEMIRSIQ